MNRDAVSPEPARSQPAIRARVAHNFWERFLGLMGRTAIGDGEALLLKPCNAVHTMFMRFPLDLAFLDDTGTVVSVRRGLKPWRVAGPVRSAHQVLELPLGALDALGVHQGTVVTLDEREGAVCGPAPPPPLAVL